MIVKNFVRIVWTVFKKFEIFIERSEKRYASISSRKIIQTKKAIHILKKFLKPKRRPFSEILFRKVAQCRNKHLNKNVRKGKEPKETLSHEQRKILLSDNDFVNVPL